MLAVVPKHCISKASLETNFASVERKCNVSTCSNNPSLDFNETSYIESNRLHGSKIQNNEPVLKKCITAVKELI